jgi:hypothetical protein
MTHFKALVLRMVHWFLFLFKAIRDLNAVTDRQARAIDQLRHDFDAY